MEVKQNISLYEYRDYRDYLKDWYGHTKKVSRSFSFRFFSQRAGLSSPNFLKLVMENKRNLSVEGVKKFSKGLGHNKSESDFFKNLVSFNQAKTFEEKQRHEALMMKSHAFSKVKPVQKDQFQLYNAWYHPIVLELMTSKKFDGTPEWVSKKTRPQIPVGHAKRSMDLLERLGFIKQVEFKKWVRTEPLVTTGPETDSTVLTKYHLDLLKLAGRLLPRVDPEHRDVSSMTIGVKKDMIPELKEMIREFQNKVIQKFSLDEPPENVVLLNVQLLPVTEI